MRDDGEDEPSGIDKILLGRWTLVDLFDEMN
jgi:hypothetical protein